MEHVTKGELNISNADKQITDKSEQRKTVASVVQNTLETLKAWYFLIG